MRFIKTCLKKTLTMRVKKIEELLDAIDLESVKNFIQKAILNRQTLTIGRILKI